MSRPAPFKKKRGAGIPGEWTLIVFRKAKRVERTGGGPPEAFMVQAGNLAEIWNIGVDHWEITGALLGKGRARHQEDDLGVLADFWKRAQTGSESKALRRGRRAATMERAKRHGGARQIDALAMPEKEEEGAEALRRAFGRDLSKGGPVEWFKDFPSAKEVKGACARLEARAIEKGLAKGKRKKTDPLRV